MLERMFRALRSIGPMNKTGILKPGQCIFIGPPPCPFLDGRKNELFIFLCQMPWYGIPNLGKLGYVGWWGMLGKIQNIGFYNFL